MAKFLIPGSEFIGPGNDIGFAPPRNIVDVLAKEHDICYCDSDNIADCDDKFLQQLNNVKPKDITEYTHKLFASRS